MKYSRYIFFFIVSCFFFTIHAQEKQADKKSNWKGFNRVEFQFQGKKALLTKPKKALPGNPWLWRARFPDYHTEIDSMLLAKGFHVAYVNTDNKFGSPKAVVVWNQFYDFLIKKYNLQKKVALHGHSRGGLFIYNWAKSNPDKVACIYGDAVVCDFKSWPAGLEDSKGSPVDWRRLKKEYGFANDDEAKAYRNNPVDNLQGLVAHKVPILHTISLGDKVVPATENSLVLVNNYIRLGGTATIAPCKLSKDNVKGHHYAIDNPELVIDFILKNSINQGPINAANYHVTRNGLFNSQVQFQNYKKARVAFLGGSITYNGGWRDSICNYLTKKFPATEFEFIAAGVPSMGSTSGAFRLEKDILSKGKIDLLFEEAAVNDAGKARTDIERIRAMEGIVRHVKKDNPTADIVMMHFVDPYKMDVYKSGKEPAEITNFNKVAEHYGIPTINLALEVTDRIEHGEFTWKDDFKNLHPSPFGQGIYARSMIQFLENTFAGYIDNDDKKIARVLPTPLDEFNYENGTLLKLEQIKLKKEWSIDKNWKPKDKKRTRANYVNVPMLISETPGSKLKFSFTGNAVGLTVVAGPDAGVLEYRIDKGDWQKLNLFTKWSASLHLPKYFTLASGLSSKKHKVELKISKEKDVRSKGNACRIRYIYINKQL